MTIAEFAASGAGSGNESHWNDGTRTLGTGAPASYVSLYEAMKYCNYLTSGNVNDGVYTFSGGVYQSTMNRAAMMAGGLDAVATDPNKIYALPTEDEWYKAAYWTGLGYSDYANGDDVADGAPTEGGSATGWNYNFVNSFPDYMRDVALGTVEQNGTVNMMGNVWEWVEDSAGIRRGGCSYYDESDLCSSNRLALIPSFQVDNVGFRPVEVAPESATETSPVMNGLNVSWQSEAGQDYSVLTTTNLVAAPWVSVMPGWTNSGTGNIMVYTNSYPEDRRFFKVDTWYQ